MGAYGGSLTREQFMFREMRMAARMRQNGINDAAILDQVFAENLFQYPTPNEIRSKCRACLSRIRLLEQVQPLPEMLADGPLAEARLAALTALMMQNQLVEDFMLQVVGAKYRRYETSLTRGDIGLFLMETRQRMPAVAAWSDATTARIRGVLRRCLVEAEYLRDNQDDTCFPCIHRKPLRRRFAGAGFPRICRPSISWTIDGKGMKPYGRSGKQAGSAARPALSGGFSGQPGAQQ